MMCGSERLWERSHGNPPRWRAVLIAAAKTNARRLQSGCLGDRCDRPMHNATPAADGPRCSVAGITGSKSRPHGDGSRPDENTARCMALQTVVARRGKCRDLCGAAATCPANNKRHVTGRRSVADKI